MKKRLFALLLALFTFPLLTGCYDTVPAGNVGVIVHLLGSSKGVDNEVVGTGRYWIGINEQLVLFPTFQQNYVWTASKDEGKEKDESFTFQTSDGMTIGTDVGVSYQIDPTKVSVLFQKYRGGLDELTSVHLRSAVRDELNKQGARDSILSLIGAGKGRLFQGVQDSVGARFAPLGVTNVRLYIVGNFRLPAAIEKSINDKIAATQKAQQAENELATARAEAAKEVATAEGEAKANAIKQQTITPALLQMEAIKKWDGHLPQVTSSGTPFINLK